jgi:hypothetical protein
MNLDKRLSYVAATIFYALTITALYVFNFVAYKGSLFIAFIAFFVVIYFLVMKRLEKTLYFGLLTFSTISFLYFFTSLNFYSVIAYIVLVTIGFYLNMLAVNIYNISEKTNKPLPLLQAAKLVVFIALILITFLSSTIIYKFYFERIGSLGTLGVQLGLFILLFSVLYYSIMNWFFYEDKVGEIKARNTLVSIDSLRLFAILYMTQLSFILVFTRVEDFGRGLFLAANTYALINFIQAVINRTLNKRLFIESISLILLIFLVIYYL